jgi:VWFA-related protein
MLGAPPVLASLLLLAAGFEGATAAPAATPSPPGSGGPPAVARQAAAAEPTYFESIDVDVVSVEVFVTDKHGNPILGLRPQDFTVLEDGKPVTVTNFFSAAAVAVPGAAGAGRSPQPAAAAAEQAPPPVAVPAAAAVAAELPEEQRLDLAILVDNATLIPSARNRALRSLRGFLASRLRPQDRVLVASYGHDMKVLVEPTSDRAAVASALDRIAGEAADGVQRVAEMRQLVDDMARAMPPAQAAGGGRDSQDFSPELRAEVAESIRSFSRQREQEGKAALTRLAQFVDSLSGLPGRKAVVYVSGGLSSRPAEALFRTFETQFSALLSRSAVTANIHPFIESREVDLTPLLTQVVDHANASGVTLYTLLMGDEGVGTGADSPGSLAWSENAATEQFNRQEPMLQLAADTGGSAALDPIEPANFLGRIQHDLSAYYSLGYASPHPHDGKVHRIKVTLRDHNLSIRHRAAYRDRTGADRIRDRTVSALLFGVEENPLGMAIEVSGERRDAKGLMLVDLLIKIPMANLVLLPGERFHQGRLTLFIGARGLHGWTSNLSKLSVPVQVPNERLLTVIGQVAGYRTTLALRPEETMLAVGVRDELSQAESTLRRTYVPGQTAVPGG